MRKQRSIYGYEPFDINDSSYGESFSICCDHLTARKNVQLAKAFPKIGEGGPLAVDEDE